MGGVGGALAAAVIAQSAPLAAQEGQPAALEPASSAPAAQCPAAQSWRDFAGTSWPGDQIVNVIVIHEDGRISWNGGRTNEATLDRLAYYEDQARALRGGNLLGHQFHQLVPMLLSGIPPLKPYACKTKVP